MNTIASSPITAAGLPGGPAAAPAAHSASTAGGRHQVPTHLDVEDRPFCGLTVRQVLVLAVGGAWAYAAWCLAPALPAALRAALAGACLLLAATAALGGSGWGLLVLRYATTPRVTVWRAAAPGAADDQHGSAGAGPARGTGSVWVTWEPVPVWARRPPPPRAAGGGPAAGRLRAGGGAVAEARAGEDAP